MDTRRPCSDLRFEWTEIDTVSADGDSFNGTGQITYFDVNGNQVGAPLPELPLAQPVFSVVIDRMRPPGIN